MSAEEVRQLSKAWRQYNKASRGAATDLVVGFAASFTIDPLVALTGGLLLEANIGKPRLINADYNQLFRVCLDHSGYFGVVQPDIIVLIWRLEDLVSAPESTQAAAAFNQLISAIITLRANFSGTIILSLPPRPRPYVEGLAGFSRPSRWHSLWVHALAQLAAICEEQRNVFTIDIEAEITRIGVERSIDDRKDLLYRQPYTDDFFWGLSRQVLRLAVARKAEPKKCIVIDCDNTLWGGIIGEDGLSGIDLSHDFPGRPFVEFQRQLKVLRDSGIFIAVSSKNNPDDVETVFRQHGGMVLSFDDVSCWKVNWRPKSENIAEISRELNIGLDSIVFLDDSRFEIGEVQAHLPAVVCIQLPEDTENLPGVLIQNRNLFDRLDITEDDRRRVEMMKVERERRSLLQKLTTEDFLKTLDLRVTISALSATELTRTTQLINKTNQFNVTTKRYSADEVAAMMSDQNTDIFFANVSDRFGAYGLVGVGVLRYQNGKAVLDSLLMSCRVLGRGVEGSLIAHAVSLARNRSCLEIEARFIPTSKNSMVANLFDLHGFSLIATDPTGGRIYMRPTDSLTLPDHLVVVNNLTAAG